MAAIKGGRSVDTTMGMTPLAGLVMGTRSGDLDPSILHLLAEHEGMSPQALDEILNKHSGLQGLCGDNDMRQVLQRVEAGDGRAAMALAVYTYRIKTYIGAYLHGLPGPRGCPGLHGGHR
jgi:acetate kinase